MNRASAAVTRPVRTAVQGTPAYVIVLGIDTFVHDFTKYEFGVAVLVATLALSSAHAAVENLLGRGFLRDVPPTTDPIVDAP